MYSRINSNNIFSIIIPVHNEAQSIGPLIDRILQCKKDISEQICLSGLEVIIINDGSTDNTLEIITNYREVKLINLIKHCGYGAALKTGFKNARGNILAFLDGDNTYPPEELASLCKALFEHNAHIVTGSRLSNRNINMPWSRFIGNIIFTAILNWLSNSRITDATTGMRVFRADILPQLYPLPDSLNFSIVMTAKSLFQKLKILETPIYYHKRAGYSKLNIVKDGFMFLQSIFYIASLYAPIKILNLAGTLFILTGIMLSIVPIKIYLQARIVPDYYIYRFLFILLMFTGGLNLIIFGLLNKLITIRFNGRFISYPLINILAILLFITGICINHQTIYQYITTGQLNVPWIRPLTGGILFLAGLQLIAFSFIITKSPQK